MSDISNQEPTKICSKCKVEKPVSEFYKRKDRKNGFGYCIPCCNKANSKYYFNNIEKVHKHKKEYRHTNRDKIKEKVSQYYFSHKEKMDKINRQYNIDNKEKMDAWKKEYRIKNKEKWNEYGNLWRKNKIKNDINFKILSACRLVFFKKQSVRGISRKIIPTVTTTLKFF
jgi:hypothetical protein